MSLLFLALANKGDEAVAAKLQTAIDTARNSPDLQVLESKDIRENGKFVKKEIPYSE